MADYFQPSPTGLRKGHNPDYDYTDPPPLEYERDWRGRLVVKRRSQFQAAISRSGQGTGSAAAIKAAKSGKGQQELSAVRQQALDVIGSHNGLLTAEVAEKLVALGVKTCARNLSFVLTRMRDELGLIHSRIENSRHFWYLGTPPADEPKRSFKRAPKPLSEPTVTDRVEQILAAHPKGLLTSELTTLVYQSGLKTTREAVKSAARRLHEKGFVQLRPVYGKSRNRRSLQLWIFRRHSNRCKPLGLLIAETLRDYPQGLVTTELTAEISEKLERRVSLFSVRSACYVLLEQDKLKRDYIRLPPPSNQGALWTWIGGDDGI